MRPLEWLLLLSFLPVLVLPFVPQLWRRSWLMIAALLPALVCVVHLIAEGWRIQMAPVYVLVVLTPMIAALMGRMGRAGLVRRRWGMLASVPAAFALVLTVLLAGWLLPVISLPAPAGPYPVGLVDRELVDEARGRRLMVSVWYPAAENGAPAPLTHYPDEVAAALGNLSGLPGILLQHLRYINLSASENVPVLPGDARFPVLIFSHGMVGLRLQNSSTLQDLASWGYIVIAVDHTDAAAVTVFPDGEARFYNLEHYGIPAGREVEKALVDERVFPVWVEDQRFIYDTIEAWAASDPLLAGRINLDQIGSFGHSFGGATALEICRIEARCLAAVNLDGGLYGDLETQPAVRPLLLLSSAGSSQLPEAVAGWQKMIAQADAPAYWLELPHSSHFSFTITQLLSPFLVPEGFNPREGLHVVDQYLRAFFDTHLRDEESPLLQVSSETAAMRWLHP